MKTYRYSLLELNTHKSKPETDIHHSQPMYCIVLYMQKNKDLSGEVQKRTYVYTKGLNHNYITKHNILFGPTVNFLCTDKNDNPSEDSYGRQLRHSKMRRAANCSSFRVVFL